MGKLPALHFLSSTQKGHRPVRVALESFLTGERELLSKKMPSTSRSPFYRAKHQSSPCHVSSHDFLQ